MCFLEISYKLASEVDRSHMWNWHGGKQGSFKIRLDVATLVEISQNLIILFANTCDL